MSRRFSMPVAALLLAFGAAWSGETPAGDPPPLPRDSTVLARASAFQAAGQQAEAIALLETHLRQQPDDQLARQALLAARISQLESEIRIHLAAQAGTKGLVIANPEYEAARARSEEVVRKRLDLVEYFIAEHRFADAVETCNAILVDYPGHPAVLQIKVQVLRALQGVLDRERKVLNREGDVRHVEAVNEVVDAAIMPRDKPKQARTVFVFEEDIEAAERERVRRKLQERIDLIQNAVEVRKVIEYLFSVAGINYVIRDDAIGSETLTIHLVNESLETVLQIVSKQVNLRYNYIAGTVYITGSDSDVLETKIIRLSSGLTDVLLKPQLLDVQGGAGGGGAGGGAGGAGGGVAAANLFGQQGAAAAGPDGPPTDLMRLVDKLPELIVGWPADGKYHLDRKSTTLYVKATPAAINEVERLLKALDYQSAQILIETRFVEIRQEDQLELGVDWSIGDLGKHFGYNAVNDSSAASQLNAGQGLIVGAARPNRLARAAGIATAAGGGSPAAVQATVQGLSPITASITALEQKNRARTLTAPRIMVLNNGTGLIEISQEIAYISGFTNQAVPSAQILQNQQNNQVVNQTFNALVPQLETAKEAIALQITPSMGRNSDLITLNLTPSVVELIDLRAVNFDVPDGQGGIINNTIEKPFFANRRLATTLHVKNGETIVLGGLQTESVQKNKAGLPFINRVPVLGLLFGRESTKEERRNLIILVTAHIIDPNGSKLSDEIRVLRDTWRAVTPVPVRAEIERHVKGATADVPAASDQRPGKSGAGGSGTAQAVNPWEKGRGR